VRGLKNPIVLGPNDDLSNYPGYLGTAFDGSLSVEDMLKPLAEFPWREYRDYECVSDHSSERTIEFLVGSRKIEMTFDRDMIDLVQFLYDFPTILVLGDEDVMSLEERLALGPASGGTISFLKNDEYETKEIVESIQNCLASLRSDFDKLKNSA